MRSVSPSRLRETLAAALFASSTALLAWVYIPLPFSPVPVSGQTLAVLLAGGLLQPRTAVYSQLTYLGLGFVGLPVFAGGTAGPGVLFGPTGGYLWGFVLCAWFVSHQSKAQAARQLLVLLGGLLIIYTCGVAQLAAVAGLTIGEAVTIGLLPYLPGDVFKLLLAHVTLQRWKTLGVERR